MSKRFLAAVLLTGTGICLFCLALVTAPSRSEAQKPPVLTQTLSVKVEGLSFTVHYPNGWSAAQEANVYKLLNVPAKEKDTLDAAALDKIAQIMIFTEHRRDHAEAVRRLKEIEAETDSPSTFLTIGGWPALQRRHLAPKPQPGQGPLLEEAGEMVLEITTAVAAGDLLVELDGRLRPDAPPRSANEVEVIGQSLVFTTTGDPGQVNKEIEDLRKSPLHDSSLFTPAPDDVEALSEGAKVSEESAGAAVRVTGAIGVNSELEVAVSTNGRNIVIGSNGVPTNPGYSFSIDGGQTFNPSTGISGNDPSLAFGLSGTFYAANIILPTTTPPAPGATGIWASANNGAAFAFRANAFTCPMKGPNVCPVRFPDQEHIAADRFNAAPGGDQVYSAWRQLDGRYGIVCSANSGMSWGTAPDFTRGDFPRITVGQDGFVYVVFRRGSSILLNKYNSCANNPNMKPLKDFPHVVAAGSRFRPLPIDVTCPVPGLDRCNNGNVLSSHTVAIDDTNPNHIYVAYALHTASNNEDIVVQDSTDGGRTWPAKRVVVANTKVPGRRFMPWVGTTDGKAFVTWYDRRVATPCPKPPCPGMNNDLTDYFGGSAALDMLGNLTTGTEFRITSIADPQCASGWPQTTLPIPPIAPRAKDDSESCSMQPEFAGVCCDQAEVNKNGVCVPAPTPKSSLTRCDFSNSPRRGSPPCGANEVCAKGGGSPKYGDYNGNACAVGRLFTAWASATSPQSIMPASTDIDIFFSSFLVGNVPQIQLPGGVNLPDTTLGTTSTATLFVCNTGNADLEVTSITSSDSQFSVTTPTSGFPVVISPDFCFPFQVNFTPASAGPQSSTLTISSNDPANPSQTVQATGRGVGQMQMPRILVVPDNIDLGNTTLDTTSTATLFVCNIGNADLEVTSITSSDTQFSVTMPTSGFPVVIAPISCFPFQVNFTPASAGPQSSTLTISSNDPVNPAMTAQATGVGTQIPITARSARIEKRTTHRHPRTMRSRLHHPERTVITTGQLPQ
jgi:HYDIN/CFA65/VesB family protein